ncbi:hypothetical protein [Flagellimonas sp. CMM7]|uniref:hypothetical protein n=1 Tax=Flagellimonas sp. CMM7 TaxID=2654676 RepID=UPI0013D6B6DF|nr:hypothetical protein [Flagellimonas sp. CMM7]UII78495.1 hypothetical protein LV704_12575 [Flagellimonas sp. CMM7]
MKSIFSGIVLFLCFTYSMAQQSANVQPGVIGSYQKGLQGIGPDFGNNPASENFYNQMRDKLANMGIEQKIELKDIEGSIYLEDEFVLGTIFFNGNEESKMYMRYNAFNDEFEIRKSKLKKDGVLALLKNSNISCSFGGDKFKYTSFLDDNSVKSYGYLKMIYSTDNYKLFEQNRKLFKEGKRAKTSHAVSFPHRFVDEINYYISIDDNDPVRISRSKKELVDLFRAEHQNKIKQFLKEKNVDLKSRSGLVNLVAFSGTL